MAVETLADTVSRAEQLRQQGNHSEVQALFDQQREFLSGWLNTNTVLTLGMLGLARIQHVDANSQMKQAPDHGRQEIYDVRILPVEALYKQISWNTVPPRTIHSGPIYWSGEIAQDRANSQIVLGHKPEAVKILFSEIIKTNLHLGVISALSHGAEYCSAVLSSLGIMYYRLGILNHSLSNIYDGYRCVRLADVDTPNPHRLATISSRLLVASVSPEFSGDPALRLCSFIFGLMGYTRAFIKDPRAAVNSISQFVRESRNR